MVNGAMIAAGALGIIDNVLFTGSCRSTEQFRGHLRYPSSWLSWQQAAASSWSGFCGRSGNALGCYHPVLPSNDWPTEVSGWFVSACHSRSRSSSHGVSAATAINTTPIIIMPNTK